MPGKLSNNEYGNKKASTGLALFIFGPFAGG
ncbi:hypothetical protein PS898_03001 [Pseudomonas fluorescens]|nr:hypothetical protein PS898_03001 [Pseudomonas fluorescens]